MGFIFDDKTGELKIRNLILTIAVPALLIVLIWVVLSTFVTIDAGHRGVVLKWGEVQERVLSEGLWTITPIAERVVSLDVRTQKYEAFATAASKDLQDTTTTVAVNYHLDPSTVNTLYREIGIEYGGIIIQPTIQEVVKASTAKFTAEELITQRPKVKEDIELGLEERLNSRGIVVETVSITDFRFSSQFTQAIEQKVTAQQLALKAQNDLERIKIEAQQKIEVAKGDAESIRVIQEQLSESPDYIEFLATQKWDGKLPLATGGTVPFIEIPTAE